MSPVLPVGLHLQLNLVFAGMKVTEWMRRLDRRVLGPGGYDPKSDTERLVYLQQSVGGLPGLGYAEVVRPFLIELTREVISLRAEVETLKRASGRGPTD